MLLHEVGEFFTAIVGDSNVVVHESDEAPLVLSFELPHHPHMALGEADTNYEFKRLR